MGPNSEKVRQVNINRAMHAEQMDQKGKYQKNPGEPSNSIVIKKEGRWKKLRRRVKRLSSKKRN